MIKEKSMLFMFTSFEVGCSFVTSFNLQVSEIEVVLISYGRYAEDVTIFRFELLTLFDMGCCVVTFEYFGDFVALKSEG